MSKSIEQLIAVLKEECNIYKDYLDLAQEKKNAVIKGEIKELDHITKQEQSMIIHMGKANQIREAIIGNILLEKNVSRVEDMTELANILDEPEKTNVLKLKDHLKTLLEEIRKVNELNNELLHQALDYVEYNMNLVTSVHSEGSTYGNKANGKDLKTRSNVFDAKI